LTREIFLGDSSASKIDGRRRDGTRAARLVFAWSGAVLSSAFRRRRRFERSSLGDGEEKIEGGPRVGKSRVERNEFFDVESKNDRND